MFLFKNNNTVVLFGRFETLSLKYKNILVDYSIIFKFSIKITSFIKEAFKEPRFDKLLDSEQNFMVFQIPDILKKQETWLFS